MALSEKKAAMLAAYCRIDPEDQLQRDELESFYETAISYLEIAGVKEPPEGTSRERIYDTVLKALVLDLYEHRGAGLETATVENPSFRRMLNQLKVTN